MIYSFQQVCFKFRVKGKFQDIGFYICYQSFTLAWLIMLLSWKYTVQINFSISLWFSVIVCFFGIQGIPNTNVMQIKHVGLCTDYAEECSDFYTRICPFSFRGQTIRKLKYYGLLQKLYKSEPGIKHVAIFYHYCLRLLCGVHVLN